MTYDPCKNCPDYGQSKKECPGRTESSRILPKKSRLKRSVYEQDQGLTKPHSARVIDEVGLFLPERTSGDVCHVIQKLEWDEEHYLRLAYYVRNPEKNKWTWGQMTQIIQEDDFTELLNRAKKRGIIKPSS